MNTNAKKATLINRLTTQVKERMDNGKLVPTCGAVGGSHGHGHGQSCSGLF